MSVPRTTRTSLAAVAVAAALDLPLSGCSFPGGGSSAPEPVASVSALTGRTTAVKLDKGFALALASLKLTPGSRQGPSGQGLPGSSRSPAAT